MLADKGIYEKRTVASFPMVRYRLPRLRNKTRMSALALLWNILAGWQEKEIKGIQMRRKN